MMKTEWLILADHADIAAGKLYVNGGGWDMLTANTPFPVAQHMAIAAAFSVPWEDTNQRHTIEIEVLTADGESLAKAGGQIEVGRPAGLPPGQTQRAQLAVNLTLTLTGPGTYVIVSRIEGQEDAQSHFNVVPGPLLAMSSQQGVA